MGSDRGEDACHRENKTMTTTSLSSLSSLVSLRRVLATSLAATRPYSSVESLVALGPWVRVALSSGRWLHCRWWALVVQRCWWDSLLLGGRCRSLGAGRRLPLRILGGQLVCVTWQRATEGARVVVDVGDVGVRVVVVFHCQAIVVVCGQPGMFVVVGVTSLRRGGTLLLSWWLWDEEGSLVTICDTCDFGINVPTHARDRAWFTLAPKFVVYTVL